MGNLRNSWNVHVWQHRERTARLIFLLYLLIYPGSIISVAFGLVPPESRWFGGVLMIFQGLSLIFWLWHAIGRASFVPNMIVLIGSFIVEYAGATTDVLFGPYDYTDVLGFRIGGVVPVVILFAWIMATYGAWMVAAALPVHSTRLKRALMTGVVIAVFDLQIEPVAVLIHGYWVWDIAGFYYGVPLQNFFGWFAVGVLFSLLVDTPLLSALRRGASRLPLLAFGGSCVMFLVMNAVAGHWIAASISLCTLAGLVWVWQSRQLQG